MPGENLPTEDQSRKYLPIADWLFHYQKDWLRPDLIAGLTAAAVVIPKAMAYATIAGLLVQVGPCWSPWWSTPLWVPLAH
jgi:SulP family sulfate permease